MSSPQCKVLERSSREGGGERPRLNLKKDSQEGTVAHHIKEMASANSTDVGATTIASHHLAAVEPVTL